MLFISAYMLSTGLKVMAHSRTFYSTGNINEGKKEPLPLTAFCAVPKLTKKV